MSNELLASKIVVIEEEPKVRGIPSLPTAVAGAVGVAETGPFNKAVLCTSFDDYEATFGGFTATSDLALAAKGFFENGGSQLWVCRAGGTGATKATTTLSVPFAPPGPYAGLLVSTVPVPFSLQNGQYLRVTVDALGGQGTFREIAFEGVEAVVIGSSDGPITEPFTLADGQSMTMTIDGGAPQTVTFQSFQFADITQATALEVCAVINASISGVRATRAEGSIFAGAVAIQTLSRGTQSSIEIGGGPAAGALGFFEASASGFGSVPNLNSVTVSDIQALLDGFAGGGVTTQELATGSGTFLLIGSTTVGSTSSIQITGTAAAPMGLDTELHVGGDTQLRIPLLRVDAKIAGPSGNGVSVLVTSSSDTFSLAITMDGQDPETFEDLVRSPDLDNFVETVVNHPVTGSKLVRVTDLGVLTSQGPEGGSGGQLQGGSEGPPPDETAFIGSEAAGTGLHAFDNVQDVSLILVPGQATVAIHNAMIQYCEVTRDGLAFAVLDPPAGFDDEDIVAYVEDTASLEDLSEYGAIYWPRVAILNPDKSVYGPVDRIIAPPSGIIAGVYARTDGASPGGVYVEPAGIENGRMFGVLGFESDFTLDESFRDEVYPHQINPLTTAPGFPKYIDGARTLKSDGVFPSIAERRGVIFIERSLRQGLEFARHSNNTPELRAQVRRTITAFLLTQMNNGAFASREPTKAFFVDVSDQLNTPSVIAAGKLLARVGLATAKPAEYVVLQLSQDTRTLDAELAGGGAS